MAINVLVLPKTIRSHTFENNARWSKRHFGYPYFLVDHRCAGEEQSLSLCLVSTMRVNSRPKVSELCFYCQSTSCADGSVHNILCCQVRRIVRRAQGLWLYGLRNLCVKRCMSLASRWTQDIHNGPGTFLVRTMDTPPSQVARTTRYAFECVQLCGVHHPAC